MKIVFVIISILAFSTISFKLSAQPLKPDSSSKKSVVNHLYIDVHQLEPGKVKFEAVAEAHKKDLVTQDKYGVNFMRYWVDEKKGLVYCLSSARDSGAVKKTHAEAHGLLPANIYEVTEGEAAAIKNKDNLFLDIHYLGAGNVTAQAVAEAHLKDLNTQNKYGVNFINYWVNEKEGVVMCLSQAKDSSSIVKTHQEAHGLLPKTILKVKQGE